MKKLNSKIPTIKKLIALDPSHPGSLTPQQYKKKGGKKSKKYYIWQSSYDGKKIQYRIPDNQVEQLKKIIKNAKEKSSTETKKDSSIFRSYKKAMDELIQANKKIRKENGDNPLKKTEKKDK